VTKHKREGRKRIKRKSSSVGGAGVAKAKLLLGESSSRGISGITSAGRIHNRKERKTIYSEKDSTVRWRPQKTYINSGKTKHALKMRGVVGGSEGSRSQSLVVKGEKGVMYAKTRRGGKAKKRFTKSGGPFEKLKIYVPCQKGTCRFRKSLPNGTGRIRIQKTSKGKSVVGLKRGGCRVQVKAARKRPGTSNATCRGEQGEVTLPRPGIRGADIG